MTDETVDTVWATDDVLISPEQIKEREGMLVLDPGIGIPVGSPMERGFAERHEIPFTEEEPPQGETYFVLYAEGVSAKAPLGVYSSPDLALDDAQKLWALSDGYHSFELAALKLDVLYKPVGFNLTSYGSIPTTDKPFSGFNTPEREPWRAWDR
jgi:hypothetical protein